MPFLLDNLPTLEYIDLNDKRQADIHKQGERIRIRKLCDIVHFVISRQSHNLDTVISTVCMTIKPVYSCCMCGLLVTMAPFLFSQQMGQSHQ